MNIAHPFTIGNTRAQSRAVTPHRLSRISTYATGMMLGCFGVFMLALVGFSAYGWMHSSTVYAGTTLSGVDVGGMTRDEVGAVVDAEFQNLASTTVTFSDGANEFPVTAADLGIALDRDATIEHVMDHGRTGSPWERSLVWTRGWLQGNEVEPVMLVDNVAFSDAMEILAPDVIFAPQDARVDLNATGGATLVPDVSGRSLNVSATRERVINYLSNPNESTVALGLVSLPAGVLASDIEAGLPNAERAMSATITIEADEGTWGLSRTMLTSVVSVGDDGALNIDRDQIQTFVQGIADQVDRPAENANVIIDDSGAIVVVPQVNAAAVDVESTTESLVKAVGAGETSVNLVVERKEPVVVDATAQEWADQAESLVSDGLVLSWRGGESQLGRADLVAAMVITQNPDDEEPFSITFDREVLGATLAPLQEELDVPVREAKFRMINGEVRFQEEARQGREVDLDSTVDAIVQATLDGSDEAPVALNALEPTYTGDDRNSISLDDVLGTSQTYYGNSSEPRRHNVERAVVLEDGWLIPTDGVFSYAEVMGLVDEENDFVTGFGIVADPNGGVVTAPVIGGGICQVSTTIFQAAFWAGLKIEERWSHPYWIESYGQEPYGMLGLDAMVNIEPGWALDLKFRNTTGNWIALVMVADGENVQAQILGVDPGWDIDVPEPQITNIVEPESGMVFTDTSELPKGQELHVEHAREGFTSTIVRVVRDADGNVIDEYSYSSDFSASRDRTLRGTGSGEN